MTKNSRRYRRNKKKTDKKATTAVDHRWPPHLVNVVKEHWIGDNYPDNLTAIFRSDRFIVQVLAESDKLTQLLISRVDSNSRPTGRADDISWDDLMNLKCQAGFAGQCCVEIYPPAGWEVQYPKTEGTPPQIRHLWVYVDVVPYFMFGADHWKEQKKKMEVAAKCDHDWVSADNEKVEGMETCKKCNSVRAVVPEDDKVPPKPVDLEKLGPLDADPEDMM